MIVILTALGVGGATVAGSILGFCFKKISHRLCDITLAFSAGIMLAAAVLGLILPAVESGTIADLTATVAGILTGAICLNLIVGLVPHLHYLVGDSRQLQCSGKELDKALLFVVAIAVHNFPEGLAAGVSFGCENTAEAFLIVSGIALQNVPEGMVIIAPMLSAGISPTRTFFCALFTGLIEVIGTFVGYFTVAVSSSMLPFALGFAGGTMLYVISDEMIPETHSHGNERFATYAILIGFCIILVSDILIG